jgi:hypothetical protein
VITSSGGLLQPQRINPQNFQGYENFIPLDVLDVENASFTANILPWLNGEVVLAYRKLPSSLQASASDTLMILPTDNVLVAASALNPIIKGQDLPKLETYRGITIYIGDKSAIAFLPHVVFIGPTDLVKEGIDRWAGAGHSLIEQPGYQAVQSASPGDSLVYAYLTSDDLVSALSVLLNGDNSAEPLLKAFGEALSQFRTAPVFETSFLNAAVKSVGIGLKGTIDSKTQTAQMEATATFYMPNATLVSDNAKFDPSILNLIPRSAMVVDSGTDVSGAVYAALAALPLSDFTSTILGAFPIQPSPGTAAPNVIDKPSAEEVKAAAASFLKVLESIGGFNLQEDLLAHLSGTYAVALIPRPNDPTPVLNTPFDVLVVAQVKDGDKALAGASQLLKTVAAVNTLDQDTVQGTTFDALHDPNTGDPVIQMGVMNNTLIVATGSALDFALQAQKGDNRLITNDRWKSVSQGETPQLFVNLNSVYNTFFPGAGGQPVDQARLLTAASKPLKNDLFQIQVTVRLP